MNIRYLVFNCRQQRCSNVVFRYSSSGLCIGHTCRGWVRRVRRVGDNGSWSSWVRWISTRVGWVRSRSWSIHRRIWWIRGSGRVGGGRCRVRWITWYLLINVKKRLFKCANDNNHYLPMNLDIQQDWLGVVQQLNRQVVVHQR